MATINRGEGKKENKGVHLQALNVLMILLACIVSFFLLYAAYKTTESYGIMQDATEEYISCQQDAENMQDASDYLTEQARSFAVTGDPVYVQNFFRELEVTRRRDTALENMGVYLSGTDIYESLKEALEYSNELVNRECYSMCLTIASREYELADFPEALQKVELSPEDMALTPAEQGELACTIVFDDTYQSYKQEIRGNVDRCLDMLVSQTRSRQENSSRDLYGLLQKQDALLVILLLVVFFIVFMVSWLLIRPLKNTVLHMQRREQVPETGVYELRYLAQTYNAMLEQTRSSQQKLSYEASHDALTGLYNRRSFERFCEECQGEQVAMILADADKFKNINDTYGHEIGDQVLRKIAHLLQVSFRSEDAPCRVGGEEFAVIMRHIGPDRQDLVRQKIDTINQTLLHPEDGLPPVSVSAGVAFADGETSMEDLYKNADAALYRAKNNGRRNCTFY